MVSSENNIVDFKSNQPAKHFQAFCKKNPLYSIILSSLSNVDSLSWF